jgi:hypothetical protein
MEINSRRNASASRHRQTPSRSIGPSQCVSQLGGSGGWERLRDAVQILGELPRSFLGSVDDQVDLFFWWQSDWAKQPEVGDLFVEGITLMRAYVVIEAALENWGKERENLTERQNKYIISRQWSSAWGRMRES